MTIIRTGSAHDFKKPRGKCLALVSSEGEESIGSRRESIQNINKENKVHLTLCQFPIIPRLSTVIASPRNSESNTDQPSFFGMEVEPKNRATRTRRFDSSRADRKTDRHTRGWPAE